MLKSTCHRLMKMNNRAIRLISSNTPAKSSDTRIPNKPVMNYHFTMAGNTERFNDINMMNLPLWSRNLRFTFIHETEAFAQAASMPDSSIQQKEHQTMSNASNEILVHVPSSSSESKQSLICSLSQVWSPAMKSLARVIIDLGRRV